MRMSDWSSDVCSSDLEVSHVDAGTDLLGYRSAMPLMLSPTGMSQLFHASGEAAVARAAIAAGVPYGLSTMATTSTDAIAATGANRYFQLYPFCDRGLPKALFPRAAANGTGAPSLSFTPRDGRVGVELYRTFSSRLSMDCSKEQQKQY